MPDPWDATIVVDAELARILVEEQFPDLEPARVEPLGAGFDNTAYAVNGEWVFRFPRRAEALPLNAREIALLPSIAPRVPLPVPVPSKLGAASERFAWPFAGYRLRRGRMLCAANLDDTQRSAAAAPLARFLVALHSFPVDAAAALGAQPDHARKLDVGYRGPEASATLAKLRDAGVVGAADAVRLEAALDAQPSAARHVLVHGDLYSRHVLVDERGGVCGVIDWGDCHLGDPAVDLSVAHLCLPPSCHDAFRHAYGAIAESTWLLARFRAVVHATACVKYSHTVGDEDLLREGLLALRWIAT